MPRLRQGGSGVPGHPIISRVAVLSLIPAGIGTGRFWQAGVPQPLLCYLFLSTLSFLMYGYDKYQARNSGWRVREVLLHLLNLLGGWPGGLLAQGCFRHKTRKTSFQVFFLAEVLVHDILWVRWILS
ncbi:putative membrane protein [Xylariaceae sp. FL0662B]|nr:putative membrane protein [Xylariaceae sp. FL0662B]